MGRFTVFSIYFTIDLYWTLLILHTFTDFTDFMIVKLGFYSFTALKIAFTAVNLLILRP